MLSAVSPTAFTYAGTLPNANSEEPMMNRHAIAAFSATGLTAIALPPLGQYRFVAHARSTCTQTQLSAHHPWGMRARLRSVAAELLKAEAVSPRSGRQPAC